MEPTDYALLMELRALIDRQEAEIEALTKRVEKLEAPTPARPFDVKAIKETVIEALTPPPKP